MTNAFVLLAVIRLATTQQRILIRTTNTHWPSNIISSSSSVRASGNPSLASTWLLQQMLNLIAISIDEAPASATTFDFPVLPVQMRTRSEWSPVTLRHCRRLWPGSSSCILEQDAGVDLRSGIRSGTLSLHDLPTATLVLLLPAPPPPQCRCLVE